MPDSARLGRLLVVGTIRGRRLERALDEARAAALQADEASRTCEARAGAAVQTLDDAHAMLAADPGCPQAQLWRDHARRLRREADARAAAARDRLAEAETARIQAIAASLRHARKGDALKGVHRSAIRSERRHQDLRAEVEAERAGRVA